MSERGHPTDPQSNVHKFSRYDPDKYDLGKVPLTVRTDESLTPNRPPRLTQETIGMFLQPLTRELVELPPRPTIDDLPDAVIDNMVQRDKAFWVDKPGANAYTFHDAYYNYGMTTEMVKPPNQAVFPRSYQYDLDCVKYRRLHACDGAIETQNKTETLSGYCRNCQRTYESHSKRPYDTQVENVEQKRWRYYPDLTADLSMEQIREMMDQVGRPFKNEACNWYYRQYPPQKYNCILRKFSS